MADDLDSIILRRETERFKIMEHLYLKHREGYPRFREQWIASNTGLGVETVEEHCVYLRKKGFVDFTHGQTGTSDVWLTHEGEAEVERVRTKQSTPDFAAYVQNLIHVEQMHQSQIQQGTENSVATLTVTNLTENDRQKLQALFRSLRKSAGQSSLDRETREDLEDSLDSGESELTRRKPNAGVLREVLESLRRIFEGAGGALAAQYMPQIGELTRLIGG